MTPARHAAQIGLELAGRSAVGPLAAALAEADPVMRAHAAQALGWLKPVQATDALKSALRDSDVSVRTEAAWALGELATDDARAALAEAARFEDAATRTAAATALVRAGQTAGSGAALSPAGALLAMLAQAGTARWSLLGLTLALAAVLLLTGPGAGGRLHTGRR
jgi:HEAT repeat protein